MLCVPNIGIVSGFFERGFGRSNHYIIRGFLYVERGAWLRRGGFLLNGIFCWRIISFCVSLEINYAELSNLSCSLGEVSRISPWWGCKILNSDLLLLCQKEVGEYCWLVWTLFYILLYLFEAWIIFGVMF